MDPAAISVFVAQTLPVLEPYLPLIAAKAAEKIGGELPAAVGRLWMALSKKFNPKPAAKEALIDLLKTPDNPDVQAAFRVQLKKALEDDEVFCKQFSRLLGEARLDVSYHAEIKGDGVVVQGNNNVTAEPGAVIVQGDVQGDVVNGQWKKERS